jgi:4-aminobutyrate aminotransferase-like enzyme
MPKASLAKSESLYGVHPGVAMVQKSLAELKGNTGRSLEEWITLIKKEGPKDEKSLRAWLKTKHKLGMNSAGWIAERADGKGGVFDTPETYLNAAERYVEEQYAGPKEKLRPIFDELLKLGKSMGGM